MPNSSAARAWTFELLKVCRGKLGTDADEELAAMQKTCASIMGFVHNHSEQLNRVRRFREYYLPTTRKLLDTAQGLGDTDSANAAEIRRDITGILHTLNQAYEKLYDTLLQDVSMDVSTEIDTLEAMLRQDGLTHDFEADFNTRS
ncbi:5-bromo-4-chloroindolyl phosphate hydrolysis family protein [Gemmiger formicilis]|nr:5-bromo-4-chloroindolyl phosphate hydrolysis family protein [Gemmiger formicilis]